MLGCCYEHQYMHRHGGFGAKFIVVIMWWMDVISDLDYEGRHKVDNYYIMNVIIDRDYKERSSNLIFL